MGTGGKIQLEEGTAGGTHVGFKAPDTDVTSELIWELPATDGTAGQVMATTGSQQLYWGDFAEATATTNAINTKVTSNSIITPATATKITYDGKGLVTGSSSLLASDIPSLDAAKITSGQIDIARIPPSAIERLVVVANQTARYALTTATAQNGDTIKQTDSGEMFYVVDDANLGNSAGYAVYTAGTASACPWSGVTTKPAYVTQAASATLDGYLTAGAQDVGGVKNFVAGVQGPGTVPLGGMVTVMSSTHANFWQPPATGAIKDGFMRADGHTITAQNVTDGSVIPAGTALPNMIAKYPKGNTTSGTSSGSNSTTITSAHLPQHTHAFGTLDTINESGHTHSWGGWWSNDNSTTVASPDGDGSGNTYSDAGNGVFAGSYWGAGTYKAVGSGTMSANAVHKHALHATSPASGFGSGAVGASNSSGTGWYSSEIEDTNTNHYHDYYLPSHRHFLKARASGTATHKHGMTGSTANGGFANNSFPNEPAYVEVIWVIRVK